MTELEQSMLRDIKERVEALEAEESSAASLSDRLRHLANWLRIDAPLLPLRWQMDEFAEAARTLEALAEEVRELEDGTNQLLHAANELTGVINDAAKP